MRNGYCLIVWLLLLIAVPGLAQENVLNIMIDILEPSEEPGGMGPGLHYLEAEMSRSPLKYQSYQELASAFRSIPVGKKETVTFKLRQYLKIVIIPKKIEKRMVRFSLKLWSRKSLILDTELSLVRQGVVMIGAPGKPNLIIAISEGF